MLFPCPRVEDNAVPKIHMVARCDFHTMPDGHRINQAVPERLGLSLECRPGQTAGSFLDRFALQKDNQIVWALRYQNSHADYRVDADGMDLSTGITPETSRTDLIVLRLDLNPAGTDTATLYINPASLTEPATPTLRTTGEFTFQELIFNRLGYNGVTSRWDELSVARTFAGAVTGGIE